MSSWAASTPNRTSGVVVAALDPASPAARADIESGDLITAVDGQATATTAALSNVIEAGWPRLKHLDKSSA